MRNNNSNEARNEASLFQSANLAQAKRQQQQEQEQAAKDFARRFLLAEDRARFQRNERP